MRYYIKCKLNPKERQRLSDSIKTSSLAQGKIFKEGMQTALREATIDENDVVHFVEICYCLESGLSPMAMEIPVLNEYFDNIVEVKDARLRYQCTMECEFCDCTRNIKLPGELLANELGLKTDESNKKNLVDIGRIRLNRKKQKESIEGLRDLLSNINKYNNDENNNINVKPIFSGAALSGIFAIFYDGIDYFRIKNIPETEESRQMLQTMGLEIYDNVDSMKSAARRSLAKSDKRSNVV
ncbi:MAG: hypothetical protein K0S91_819 [Nitrososphaeraceae archaeon]|jgi:hypothetical protein|nr:hypothetical protein [Nitrososphaeraceae archaeon]